jgi:hypothetical protein
MRRIVIISVLSLAACGKGDGGAGAGGARDAVVNAWKAEKLTVSALAPAPVTFAKDCQSGTVEGVDVLLCNFLSPAEAKAAEDQGLTWVGSATGQSQAPGAARLVLVDRKKADPNGRTINRLMKLAPK